MVNKFFNFDYELPRHPCAKSRYWVAIHYEYEEGQVEERTGHWEDGIQGLSPEITLSLVNILKVSPESMCSWFMLPRNQEWAEAVSRVATNIVHKELQDEESELYLSLLDNAEGS